MRALILLLGVLLSVSAEFVGIASAQSEPLREASGERSFYVVDKSHAPVFGSSDAVKPEPGREAKLGDFFFAVEETESRVLVARYPPVHELGWMEKSDLLHGRTHALTVSEGVEQGLPGEIAPVDLDGALNANNVLLRVVTQPERRVRLSGRPGRGGESDERLERGRWFYAFDMETFDGKTWVLVADQQRMLTGSLVEDTLQAGPRRVLRGWAPLDHFTVWATNLALELNTDPLAVARRLHDASPAVIYASRHPQSEIIHWVEPITSFWSAASPHPKVRTDPVGLDPFFPRLPVLQTVLGQFEVAFAASPGDYQLYRFGEISQRVKAAELDAPDGASDLAIAVALERQGLTVDEVDRLNATIYIGGYVREPNVVLPQGGQSAATPHWRLRVLVSRRDAADMQRALYGAFRGLERALDCSPVLQGLGGRRDPAVSRRELVAAVIVRALDEIGGGVNFGFTDDADGDRHALRVARSLLDGIDSGSGPASENLARLAGVRDSLPLTSNGLLGMPLDELIEKDIAWFQIQMHSLEAQSAGWENILNDSSVPENPAEIFAHDGVAKLWFMQLDDVRGNDVAHVPFSYIP